MAAQFSPPPGSGVTWWQGWSVTLAAASVDYGLTGAGACKRLHDRRSASAQCCAYSIARPIRTFPSGFLFYLSYWKSGSLRGLAGQDKTSGEQCIIYIGRWQMLKLFQIRFNKPSAKTNEKAPTPSVGLGYQKAWPC